MSTSSPDIHRLFHKFLAREFEGYEPNNPSHAGPGFVLINSIVYHRDDAEAAKEEFIQELTNANFSEDEIAEAESIAF